MINDVFCGVVLYTVMMILAVIAIMFLLASVGEIIASISEKLTNIRDKYAQQKRKKQLYREWLNEKNQQSGRLL